MSNLDKSTTAQGIVKEIPNPEVPSKKTRRTFSVSFKLKILRELDACSNSQERNQLLRREGLYSSRISTWRKERAEGLLSHTSTRRGRPRIRSEEAETIAALEKKIAQLETKLDQAEMIIDVQKKVSAIFGVAMKDSALNEKS